MKRIFAIGFFTFALGLTFVSAFGQNDPYFSSQGAWGQSFADQWALTRIGFTPKGSGQSAWDIETGETQPIIKNAKT